MDMLRTALPELIEQAHEEAFARLSPEQRRLALERLRAELPERERAASTGLSDDPRSLARLATRAEVRQPGTLQRIFGGARGVGTGGMMAGGFLGALAGSFLGTTIAQQFFATAGLADIGGGLSPGGEEEIGATGDEAPDTGAEGLDTGLDDLGDFGAEICPQPPIRQRVVRGPCTTRRDLRPTDRCGRSPPRRR